MYYSQRMLNVFVDIEVAVSDDKVIVADVEVVVADIKVVISNKIIKNTFG